MNHIDETTKIVRGETDSVCDVCGYEATPAQMRHFVVTMCADGVKRCKVCGEKAFGRYHQKALKRAMSAVEREQERLKRGLPV